MICCMERDKETVCVRERGRERERQTVWVVYKWSVTLCNMRTETV